jgi:hypothetical protein
MGSTKVTEGNFLPPAVSIFTGAPSIQVVRSTLVETFSSDGTTATFLIPTRRAVLVSDLSLHMLSGQQCSTGVTSDSGSAGHRAR